MGPASKELNHLMIYRLRHVTCVYICIIYIYSVVQTYEDAGKRKSDALMDPWSGPHTPERLE